MVLGIELDNILEPLEWLVESWLFARLFWHKNNLSARLDAWAKCDSLLLNESNLLWDSEASNYWKLCTLIEQYSSNPCNIRRKKRIWALSIQLELSTPNTLLTIWSKRSTIVVEENNLIHHQLRSKSLNTQTASYIFDASASNTGFTASLSTKKKQLGLF